MATDNLPDNAVRPVLSDDELRKNAHEIDSILRSLQRPGIANLADWLKTTDFYKAPASTKYHLNHPGGLAIHSLNVYHRLQALVEAGLVSLAPETVAITALLHDLCKANFYGTDTRNVKVDGEWQSVSVWTVKEEFPVGHGEKSCYYTQRYIQLSEEEYAMIRLHMGPETGKYPDPFSACAAKFPGVAALHIADLEAAFLIESRP